jgi:hypothetical protein
MVAPIRFKFDLLPVPPDEPTISHASRCFRETDQEFPVNPKKFPVPAKKFPVLSGTGNSPATY